MRDQRGDARIDGGDLFFDLMDEAAGKCPQLPVAQLSEPILFCHKEPAQVAPLGVERTQLLLLSRRRPAGPRLLPARRGLQPGGHGSSKSRQHPRIDLVGLGQDAGRTCIVPYPASLHQTDFELPLPQCLEQSLLVAATGFAEDLHRGRLLFDPFY